MCGAPPPPKKLGWSQLTDPVIEHRLMVQWEPDLVQEFDTSVVVRCDRPEDYNRTVKFNLDNVLDKNIISRFATHPGPQMWMEIQRGEGPKAKPLEGPVFLGETLTLVFTIADPAFWFDSNVLSCWASDGLNGQKAITWLDPTKPAPARPILSQISVIENSCSVKPKLFGHFQKVPSEFPNELTVTQWVYFQAFRFPTSSRVQIQCDIQVCFSKCPPMPPCSENYSPRSRGRRAADANVTSESKNISPEQLSLTRALEVLLREEEEPSCSTSTSFSLTSYIMDKLRSAENRLSSYRQKLLTILRTEQWMDQVKVLASERPLTSAAVCAAALCAAGPLLAVFLVAATAVIFAFLGFVFIEGTLLTLGTMFVGVTLCVAACIAFPVAAFLGIVYLSMSFVMQLYSSISETLKQLFVTQEEADAAAFAAHQRVRYMSGSLSPTHPLVPSCITDSDAILSRRMAANGHGKHLTCDYYPMGFPVRCMTNNGDSCMSNTAECG